MTKIKVLQIGGNTQKNGITSYLLDTFKALHERFQFVFLNTGFNQANETVKKTIEAYGGYIVHLPYKGDFEDIRDAFRRVLETEQPDVVHSHYFFSNGDFLKVADEQNVPVRIAHCHNDKSAHLSENEKALLGHSRKLCAIHATHKLAVSEEAGRFHFGDDTFQVKRMVFDVSNFHPIADLSNIYTTFDLNKKHDYVIFVGRFAYQKNVFFFIDLLKHFVGTNHRLIMVGHGKLKPDFIAELKKHDLENYVFFRDDSDINALLNGSRYYLLPSFYEGASLSLLEAQRVGIPCLVSNHLNRDSDFGLVTYLPLTSKKWMHAINKPSVKNPKPVDIGNEELIAFYDDLYSNHGQLADTYLDLAKAYKLGSEKFYCDREKAYACYQRTHQLGDVRGTFYMALAMFEGSGTSKSPDKAREIIRSIYDRLQTNSNNKKLEFIKILGDIHSFGILGNKDLKKTEDLYAEAASLGNLEAMCSLAYMYEVGAGVKKDPNKAFSLYKASAEKGYLHSMRDVGLCYLHGIGTEPSLDKAKDWFKKASAQNYAHATADLALLFLREENHDDAIHYFKTALKQDFARAKRDILSHSIDYVSLTDRGIIQYTPKTKIHSPKDIDENILIENTAMISKTITDIWGNSFYNHQFIDKFFVEKDNPVYASHNGVLYSKDQKTLVRFPLGSPTDHFIVPEHVEHIGDSAFDDCKNLRHITLHEEIKTIEDWAFHGCDDLKAIHIPKHVQYIGHYALGSCENLSKITVDKNNPHYLSLEANLLSKDKKRFLQYAIGKKERLFRMPKSVETIAFRAFSDAFNLEYIDARNVKRIEEKAFSWCQSLKNLILNETCEMASQNIVHETHPSLTITQPTINRLFMVADIHGHLRLDFLEAVVKSNDVKITDALIILGDAGIVWNEVIRDDVKAFYERLPCNVYFIDGNHENFDRLKTYPTLSKHGGTMRKVLSNVFHLMRGESYIIGGQKLFVFGGAYSIKRESNDSPVKTWTEELPDETEYEKGLKTLKENAYCFDYILTHQGPRHVLDAIQYDYAPKEHELLDYLDTIAHTATFKKWYFGHIHKDIVHGNLKSLYSQSEVIDNE